MNFKNILIVVAHSDDEILGMGATIAKHIDSGDKVYVMSFTDGISSRNNNQKQITDRIKSALLVSKMMNFKWIFQGNFPDNALDSISLLEIIKIIEKIKRQINPEIIYTHYYNDLNIDHRIVHQATMTAFRPNNKFTPKKIRLFEVPSSSDSSFTNSHNAFTPNCYIDVKKYYKKKLRALSIYEKEMLKYPNTRSIEAILNLMKYRGNQVGLNFAEAFLTVRSIIL